MNKEIFKIYFTGVKEIKAKTIEEATKKVEKQLKNNNTKIETKSMWYFLIKGIVINTGAMITLFLFFIIISAWSKLGKFIQTLEDDNIKLLALMAWIGIMLLTMKFPKLVGGFYDKTGELNE
jgi:hypothetical protein